MIRKIFAILLVCSLAMTVLFVVPARAASASQTPVPFDFSELAINGLSFMVLVVGIVQAAKKLGLEGRGLTILAMALGITLAIGYQVSQIYPTFKVWFDIVVFGLGGGVAATGYYDLVNERFPKTANLKQIAKLLKEKDGD